RVLLGQQHVRSSRLPAVAGRQECAGAPAHRALTKKLAHLRRSPRAPQPRGSVFSGGGRMCVIHRTFFLAPTAGRGEDRGFAPWLCLATIIRRRTPARWPRTCCATRRSSAS